jgi:hypothetical protein
MTNFDPVNTRKHKGFRTLVWKEQFLDELYTNGGHVSAASRVCGISHNTASIARKRDPEFARQWAKVVEKVLEDGV